MNNSDDVSGKKPSLSDQLSSGRWKKQGLAIALMIAILDQAIKYWVAGPLQLRERLQIELLPIFNLTWAENRGVSMGFLTTDSDMGRWILVGLTGVIALVVLIWMLREQVKGEAMAFAMILGGAIGNIADRARLGYVVDYLDLHFGDFRPFFIFNLADVAISLGVLILLARVLLFSDKQPNQS